MIEWDHPTISLRRQCVLLGLNRSSWYYQRSGDQEESLQLMRLIDNQYTRTPFYREPASAGLALGPGACSQPQAHAPADAHDGD